MSSLKLTAKQQSILRTIMCRNHPDLTQLIDLDQLLERINYHTSKASMQFSLRYLIKRELIIKAGIVDRRGSKRVVYDITDSGIRLYLDKTSRAAGDHEARESAAYILAFRHNLPY